MNDAESLWQVMFVPVYGCPFCAEEEFDDLATRIAQRGLRWVRMSQAHGVSVANRRYRGEMRARSGYGHLKPTIPTPLYSDHIEFDRSNAHYIEVMGKLIA